MVEESVGLTMRRADGSILSTSCQSPIRRPSSTLTRNRLSCANATHSIAGDIVGVAVVVVEEDISRRLWT